MSFEDTIGDSNYEKTGVQDVRMENEHYIVSIVWKDGKKNEHHFPASGFPVVDVKTKKLLGYIGGKEAVK